MPTLIGVCGLMMPRSNAAVKQRYQEEIMMHTCEIFDFKTGKLMYSVCTKEKRAKMRKSKVAHLILFGNE
jgi:hypothetical protein